MLTSVSAWEKREAMDPLWTAMWTRLLQQYPLDAFTFLQWPYGSPQCVEREAIVLSWLQQQVPCASPSLRLAARSHATPGDGEVAPPCAIGRAFHLLAVRRNPNLRSVQPKCCELPPTACNCHCHSGGHLRVLADARHARGLVPQRAAFPSVRFNWVDVSDLYSRIDLEQIKHTWHDVCIVRDNYPQVRPTPPDSSLSFC